MTPCYAATPWMQEARGLITTAEAEMPDAPTVIIHRGHYGHPCEAAITRQVTRYATAIAAIELRGEKPTARSVLRELGYAPRMQDNGYGTVIDNGMGGRELLAFAVAMQEAGYRRERRGYTRRWVKE